MMVLKTVELNPFLTPELVIEGWVNEIKRHISLMRKELGLKPEDLVKCIYYTFPSYKDAVKAAKTHNQLITKKWNFQEITFKY